MLLLIDFRVDVRYNGCKVNKMEQNFIYNSHSGLVFLHRVNNTDTGNLYYGVKHSHPSHEIYLLLKGKVRYTVNGQSFDVKPFDLLILNAYEYHFVESCTDEPYERIVLQIPPNFIPVLNEATPLNNFIKSNSFLSILPSTYVKNSQVYSIMKSMEAICLSDNEIYKDHLILAQTIHLAIELSKILSNIHNDQRSGVHYPEYAYPQLNICIQYINNNLHRPISLDDIVDQLHISRSRIQHLFKTVMGYSISDFIRKQKMQLAYAMLDLGKSPTETAQALGYEYYSTFHTAFRKFYGYSPKEQVKARKHQENDLVLLNN